MTTNMSAHLPIGTTVSAQHYDRRILGTVVGHESHEYLPIDFVMVDWSRNHGLGTTGELRESLSVVTR